MTELQQSKEDKALTSTETTSKSSTKRSNSFMGPYLQPRFGSTYDVVSTTTLLTSDVVTGNITIGAKAPRLSQLGARCPLLTGDIAARFDNIAGRMTDYIRSANCSHVDTGFLVTSPVFVRLQWAWLALPFFEAAAATALLLWTIALRRRVPALWKGSSLAMLFAEYDASKGLLRPHFEGPERVEEMARTENAKLI